MTEVMTPQHPEWNQFLNLLAARLVKHPCNATDNSQAAVVLAESFPKIHIDASVAYFWSKGGCCDCEILMNVDQPESAVS